MVSRHYNTMLLTAALLHLQQNQALTPEPSESKPVRTKPRSRMSIEREQRRLSRQDCPRLRR